VKRVTWAGEDLELRPERALYWVRRRTMMVSDPHFGKAASFQQAGLPVPDVTRDDVARLDRLLREAPVERLVFLGDFFHDRASRSLAVLETLEGWRKAHAQLEVVLVRGNHDRHAGDPPSTWEFRCVPGPVPDPPFEYRHDPEDGPVPDDLHAIAGHVHPAAVLDGPEGSRMRLPCFHFGARRAVLPAFGSFTGGRRVRPVRGDRVFVIGSGQVAEVTGKRDR